MSIKIGQKILIQKKNIIFAVESSSESTSRETTPESEGSDEEDENEDDDEETLAQQDDENNLPDIETVPAKPIIHRETSDLAEEYSKFFTEYATPEVFLFFHLSIQGAAYVLDRKTYGAPYVLRSKTYGPPCKGRY